MTKSQTFALIAFSAILAMVGFQNCSKVGVQDTSSIASGKVAANGGADVVPEQPGSSDPATPPAEQPPSQVPPVVMEPPTPMPPTSMPPACQCPSIPDADHDHGSGKEHSAGKCNHDQKADDGKRQIAVGECHCPAPQAHDGDDSDVGEINESDAVALCLNGDAKADDLKALKNVAPLSGPEVSHERGVIAIESDDLKLVEDIRGVALIRGKTAAASAKKIINTRGKMIICGMSVDELDDTRGVVVLVNSNVKSVDDHRGVIFMMNSKIEKSSNIKGVIKEIKK